MRTDRQMVMWAATVHCVAVTTAAMALRHGHHTDITIALPSPLVWCLSVLRLQWQAPHSLCDAWLSMEGGRTCCWSISHEFAFIHNGANGSRQEVGIQPHLSKSSVERGRYLSATKKESINARGGRLLWTYLNLQDKSHHLASESIPPPFDPRPFLSPNTPVCTGPSARSLDASGMPRLIIVLMCGTFDLTFCGTYHGLILICLLTQ
jgi:hypothetical protein